MGADSFLTKIPYLMILAGTTIAIVILKELLISYAEMLLLSLRYVTHIHFTMHGTCS